MKASTAAALLAIVASALFCTISAKNVACINANAKIQKFFCDGVDLTKQLANKENPNQCDCIDIPVCKVVSIKAKGVHNLQQSSPGIQFCQTTRSAVYKDWVCTPGTSVGGRSWIRNLFSRRKNWKSWAKPQGSCKTCHNVRKLPCHASCFWHEKNWIKSVDCVRTQCADQCTDCSLTGAGNCDPGKSMFNTTSVAGADVLNHQCRIDWKTWNGVKGTGYIKVTDMSSGSVSILPANEAGLYMGVIDINTCEFSFTNYTTMTLDGYNALLGTPATGQSTLNALIGSFPPYSSGQYQNTYAAVLGTSAATIDLGGGFTGRFSPGIGAVLLGTNNAQNPYVIGDTDSHSAVKLKYCSASMVITGVQNVLPNATATDPSSPTESYTSASGTNIGYTASYNYGNPC